MNGRVYDPLIGMFLSLDPFIQAPDNWLNYNRYMYCFGNPLSYTDPSGNIGVLAVVGIGAAIGAVLGTGAGLWYGYNKGYSGWDLAKSALIGAGIGTCLGAISGYFIGSSVAALMAAKTLGTFVSVGASIGEAVGIVGGTIYGLAKKADGLALANYVGLGSLIGTAAGAVIGAGCYGCYSYCASSIANANAWAAESAIADKISESINQFSGTFATDYEWTPELLAEGHLLRKNADMASQYAIIAARNAASAALRAKVAIGCSVIVGVTLAGGVTTGAGFGYHYLSNFLFDYIPSHLYGN